MENKNDHDILVGNYELEEIIKLSLRLRESEDKNVLHQLQSMELFYNLTLRLGEREQQLKEAELKVKELQAKVQMAEYKNNYLEDTDKCIVCFENGKNTFYTACMHMSTCYDCCSEIGDRCPTCREESEYKRVYIP